MANPDDRNRAESAEDGAFPAESQEDFSPVVVVTGSTRGLGFALAREFLQRGCRVLVSGRSYEAVQGALAQLTDRAGRAAGQPCDVTDPAQVEVLWDGAVRRWGRVDIWINNAGVGQDYLRAWELATLEVIRIVETNILGMMHGCRVALRGMRAQGRGAIYNVEGWGSDGQHRDGLAVYGTTKRAVRYFSKALAHEVATDEDPSQGRVTVGTLSPGMMVTDFLLGPMRRMADAEQMRRVVNILGDRPESVAAFLATKILANRKNGARFAWLTGMKATWRFLSAALTPRGRRRNLFE
jgi:NAD(P)-dependent dehydrogenase (short-subunit alcohol dehydrogenase family)